MRYMILQLNPHTYLQCYKYTPPKTKNASLFFISLFPASLQGWMRYPYYCITESLLFVASGLGIPLVKPIFYNSTILQNPAQHSSLYLISPTYPSIMHHNRSAISNSLKSSFSITNRRCTALAGIETSPANTSVR